MYLLEFIMKKAVVKETKIGKGVFAAENIRKGEFIFHVVKIYLAPVCEPVNQIAKPPSGLVCSFNHVVQIDNTLVLF